MNKTLFLLLTEKLECINALIEIQTLSNQNLKVQCLEAINQAGRVLPDEFSSLQSEMNEVLQRFSAYGEELQAMQARLDDVYERVTEKLDDIDNEELANI